MSGRHSENRLVVEGRDDQYAIASLMSHFTQWGDTAREWPVYIDSADGIDNILDADTVELHFKASNLQRVGFVVDADVAFQTRWESIRDLCRPFVPAIPDELPANGLVTQFSNGKRLGIWIMPDNQSRGMLETFLAFMLPLGQERQWQYAKRVVRCAARRGAPFHKVHIDKADIHTWLAWQDPPGRPFGEALLNRCLDPRATGAGLFVDWFLRLFELPRLADG